jgi:hypothetical protein
MKMEASEDTSKKSNGETLKNEAQPSISSNENTPITQIARLNLELQESGTFKICCPPSRAKETADVLRKLNTREQELWCKRFSTSCVEGILATKELDQNTRRFYDEIAKRLKE